MAARRCVAAGCNTVSNTSKLDNIRLFKFPSDIDRCKEWVRLAGNSSLLLVTPFNLSQSYRLCAIHFEDTDYFNKYKNSLKRTAVPSKMTSPPLDLEQMAKFPASYLPPNQVFGDETLKSPRKRKLEQLESTVTGKIRITSNQTVEEVEPSEVSQVPEVQGIPECLEVHPVPSTSSLGYPTTPPAKSCSTRVTKSKIALEAGITKKVDLTPRKISLIGIAQKNYQKFGLARRRLNYAQKHTALLAQKYSSQHQLKTARMAEGAREILAGELLNYDRPKNARFWTLKQKCFYLGIYVRSPKTFRYVSENVTTPCEKTLKNVLQSIELEPGISPFLLNVLKKKTEKFEEKDKLGVLMFDEIFTNMGLFYNPRTDRVEGYEDFGGEVGRTDREADHMMIFMVRGLNADWKIPVAFYPVKGTCPADTISQIIPELIRELAKVGVKVVLTVCDQGATNQKAISTLRAQCEEGALDPIYKVDGERIIHLWDIPHLLKNLRNNLLTSDLEYEPGIVAKWIHIIEFFKLDEGLQKLSKLCYYHLCPLGKNKMRVDLAGQVFSDTTGISMKTYHELTQGKKLPGCLPTAEFLLIVDKLFDATNGPSRKDAPKAFRQNVTADSFHHQYWRDMWKKMEKWVYIRKSTNKRHVPPCLQGYRDNLRGLGWLWKRCQSYGITTLKLRNLNQDPLENYNNQIRQANGSNTDPTIQQAVAAMKTCLVTQVTSGRNGNCHEDTTSFLTDLASLIEAGKSLQSSSSQSLSVVRGARPSDDENNILTKLKRQAPNLTCATMCSKILSVVNRCDSCTTNLTSSSSSSSSDFLFQELHEKSSSFDKPSPSMTNFYLLAQKAINDSWKDVGWRLNLKEKLLALVQGLDNEWINCMEHKDLVTSLVEELTISRIIHAKCTQFNKQLKEKILKPTRQITKSVQVAKDHGIEEIHNEDWCLLTGMPEINVSVATKLQTPNPLMHRKSHLQNALQQHEIEVAEAANDSEEFLLLEEFEKFVEQGEASTSTSNLAPSSPSCNPLTTADTCASLLTASQASTDELEGYVTALRSGKIEEVTVAQLKLLAKSRKMKGYSRLTKGPLVRLLKEELKL